VEQAPDARGVDADGLDGDDAGRGVLGDDAVHPVEAHGGRVDEHDEAHEADQRGGDRRPEEMDAAVPDRALHEALALARPEGSGHDASVYMRNERQQR
jgi:hypothetical protein